MQKIIILGCSGAGKSTLSRKLRDKTGLPLYHLDLIWHRADKTNITREEFDKRLLEIVAADRWIIDGNYSRTLEPRLRSCDLAILLDLPVEDCLEGVRARRGKPRPDMPWIETEEDPEFMQWIRDFRANQMPRIMPLLEQYRDRCEIRIFKTREEAMDFVEAME